MTSTNVSTDRVPAERPVCDVNWGSHGCFKRRGHRFGHFCCCDCGPRGLRWLLHRLGYAAHRVGLPWSGCVGRAPYYGRQTNFYGEDAPVTSRNAKP